MIKNDCPRDRDLQAKKKKLKGPRLCQDILNESPIDTIFYKKHLKKPDQEQYFNNSLRRELRSLFDSFLCSLNFEDFINFMERITYNEKKRMRNKLRIIAAAMKKNKSFTSKSITSRLSSMSPRSRKSKNKMAFGEALKLISSDTQKLEKLPSQDSSVNICSDESPMNRAVVTFQDNGNDSSEKFVVNEYLLLDEDKKYPLEDKKSLKLHLILESEEEKYE